MPEEYPETRSQLPVSSFVRITLIGSAVLGAVALLPYALLRTRITGMEQRLDRLVTMTATVERDLQKLLEFNAVRRGEHRQLGGLVADVKNSMEEARRAGERRESEQRAMNDRVLRGVHDVKTAVERVEVPAATRQEWSEFLSKFRWTAGTDKK